MKPAELLPYIVPLILVGVLYFRMRTSPARPVNVAALWIVPTIAVLGIGTELWFQPHSAFGPLAYAALAAALTLGIGMGTVRARTLSLRRCPDTGRVLMETSSFAFILLVILVIIRSALRNMAGSLGTVAIDASMLFALGMIVTQRLTIWRRMRVLA